MEKWFSRVFKFIWKYKLTIISLVVLFFTIKYISGRYSNRILLILISFYGLLNILAKLKVYISFPILLIVATFFAIDIYFPVFYGENISFGILESIFRASPQEIDGMFHTTLFQFLGLILIFFLLLLLPFKELKESKPGFGISFFMFIFYWLIFLPIHLGSKILPHEILVEEMEEHPAFILYNQGDKVPLFYRSISMYFAYKEQIKIVNAYRDIERVTAPYGTLDNTAKSPQKIYIILGESATRSHLSLYGYPIQTTPKTDSIAKVDSTLQFYNGVAGAPLTYLAIPLAFTYATPSDNTPTFKYKNVIEMMKDVGYETLWISSQPKLSVIDTKISVFSSVSDKSYHTTGYPEDINLVNKMEEWIVQDKKQFVVLHLNGSHSEYSNYYDKIDLKEIEGSGEIADYDRTIHHTDRVFEALYNKIKDEDSFVMLYFSDHGEIIGKGHGLIKGGREQFDIPFITLHRDFPLIDSIVHRYKDVENEIVNSMNIVNILTELVGYRYSEKYRENAIKEGETILHADKKIYNYSDIPK